MDTIYFKSLKKNSEKLQKSLSNKGDDIVASNKIYILFPTRYDKIGLLSITDKIKVLSSFMIMNDDREYHVVNIPVMITTEPSAIDTVMFDDIEYYKLTYYEGSKVISNRMLIKDDSFVFDVFNEFYIKGNVPTYLSDKDIVSLFLSVREYNDSNISDNPIAIEALSGILTRYKNDTTKYIRQIITDPKDITLDNMKFVALSSIEEGFNNAMSRFRGSRLKDGLNSLIVRDQTTETKIEKILFK